MATIYDTTVTPTKLELFTAWLPTRPWYQGTSATPDLAKAGGFRLDDPEGEVGLEFMVITDASGPSPVAYQIPVTYRGAPLEGAAAERAFIGTMEHGVLGTRWMYDGPLDPALVPQLLALLQNRAEPQHQNISDTPDPAVTARTTGPALPAELVPGDVRDEKLATTVTVATGEPSGPLTLSVTRVLGTAATDGSRAHVVAHWESPEGEKRDGVFAVLGPMAG
ncbi:1,4-alpha-glucan branching protein [Streptomyces sp. NPDC087440]|uniref:maltokinase N-terminal cap-like domain-containing protein n=1 Tax=Streptomyces sp. NPDC087440 TaxID=3365790 RepID=UPI00380E1E8A